ncbi:MAG TPA: hypothetical protein VJS92_15150 [Candidatus Polarisedimenticolaceae bacterium]|nr:hypothetical protein [Candidatus Polarisedimenticolaceae bacterium]
MPRRTFVAAGALALLLAAGAYAQQVRESGTLSLPPRTDAGKWDGTWFASNRDIRLVLWFKTEGGAPRVQLQFFDVNSTEAFLTDWSGEASYEYKTAPGKFALHVTEADANTLRGTWSREVQFKEATRTEQARFEMYRAADGRVMVLRLDEYKKVVKRGEHEQVLTMPQGWSLRKASNRLVLWDELGF